MISIGSVTKVSRASCLPSSTPFATLSTVPLKYYWPICIMHLNIKNRMLLNAIINSSLGSTWSWGTGPSADHTLGTQDGYFIYLESSFPRIAGDIARLHSPWVVANGHDCSVKFWYHMLGTHLGNLNVSYPDTLIALLRGQSWGSRIKSAILALLSVCIMISRHFKTWGLFWTVQSLITFLVQVFVEDSAHQRSLIWTSSKNASTEWQAAVVRIGPRPIMRVIFEGVRGEGYQGDIALDDISFETCKGILSRSCSSRQYIFWC